MTARQGSRPRSLPIGSGDGGVQQEIGAGQRPGEFDRFVHVVADALEAGREDHRRRRHRRHGIGVVAGLAAHLAIGQAEFPGGRPQKLDAFRREQLGAPAPALRDLDLDVGLLGRRHDRGIDLRAHGLEAGGIDVAEIDGELDLLGIGARQVGEAFDPGRRGAALVGGVGQADIVRSRDCEPLKTAHRVCWVKVELNAGTLIDIRILQANDTGMAFVRLGVDTLPEILKDLAPSNHPLV